MTRHFLTTEDAVEFAYQLGRRREALRHYGRALVRTDIDEAAVRFLAGSVRVLRKEIDELLAA